jgi:hypothetical protein
MIQAAVILSASVTLMTLPGLSGIARMSGLVAIMCSVLSMTTSFISIMRHKTDLTHGTPTSGSEGFVLLTVCFSTCFVMILCLHHFVLSAEVCSYLSHLSS